MNKKLNNAKIKKDDEFYTLYKDIEKEIVNYKEELKDKIIYCNCDNPSFSNFYLYFNNNFKELGIKKLITTHYNELGSYKTERIKDKEDITILEGNGSFDSEECIKILKEVDIVITNPPFSLFRNFIDLIIKHNKKFIVIGNFLSSYYKNIKPLIINKKIFLGYSKRGLNFLTKDNTLKNINACFFNNIKYFEKELVNLNKIYIENNYKKYINYNAIECSKSKDIPFNYNGNIGVPITFLEKLSFKQFEIIDIVKNPIILLDNQIEKKKFIRIIIKKIK